MNRGLFLSDFSHIGEQMANEDIDGNDRARTYWTPAMERYFIDLMIEQLHRGNRVGYTFNKQAWTDMLTEFNAKFGSQYDKDVLKGRYSNLWKQYSDVNNLLQQSCFSWDESHQMVIAGDSAWDAYFRVKSFPFFKVLIIFFFCDRRTNILIQCRLTQMLVLLPCTEPNRCLILMIYVSFLDTLLLMEDTVDQAMTRTLMISIKDPTWVQTFMLYFMFLSISCINLEIYNFVGDGFVGQMLSSTERPRTDWTSCMDQYFIELMLDQLGRGNKSGDTFNKQSWTDMLTLFNEKFGPHHGKRVLRHRYQKLWKYYREATVLLKQDGFSWDGTQQMITAEDDVWNNYIKVCLCRVFLFFRFLYFP